MPGSVFFIAEISGQPAGYARLLTDSGPTCITGANPVELVRMYSAQAWIGKGVGNRLMAACIDAARAGGHDVIWLGVWQQNPRAIAFYQKWGFRIVGEQIFQLGSDPQADYVMARSLIE